MKKLLTACTLLAGLSAPAQTLFTYGADTVSAGTFLAAYRKNNSGTASEANLRDYLQLYIASKLKVKAAREAGMDTLPQLRSDLANLRQQLLPAYLNDKESIAALVTEAFNRLQTDRQVAHFFIAFANNNSPDTAAADGRRRAALEALAKGAAFEAVAKQYSDDPAAQSTGGHLGWITAFSLPYELETAVYQTPVGQTSGVHTSKAGYHVFKVLAERKALGRMNAAQILLAFPPGASEAQRQQRKKTADSLHARILAGDDFGKLAMAFSNDMLSAAANGQMQAFGVGDYSAAFENAVYALPKDGAVSQPFATEHGYHIVKRLSHEPPAPTLTADVAAAIQTRVEGNDRMQVARQALAKRVAKEAGFQNLYPSGNELWAYTDTLLSLGREPQAGLNSGTPLFRLGKASTAARDWVAFAQNARYKPTGGVKPFHQLWNDFLEVRALQYYQEHLEQFNEDFRRQMTEFEEGNLFFEIMQQRVWTPAQTDSAALKVYYDKNKDRYRWKQSATAVIFYGSGEEPTAKFYRALRSRPAQWRRVLREYAETVTADSGRFEQEQLPLATKAQLRAGTVTAPVVNKADNTASFVYIVRLHNKPEPRSFADARGLVINDYQATLEQAWLSELKKKYPVRVDEAVWTKVLLQAAAK